MKLFLSLLVLCVANCLVSTFKINASKPITVESTNLTAVSTSGELSPEKNQTVQGRFGGNHQSGKINFKSPINNRVKRNIHRFKRETTPNSEFDEHRFIPARPYEIPFDCGFRDLRPKCKLPWYLKN
uniref:Uncharacterized protein n=1 Tax=Clastoptera arizonana TaxID=38151 RepID=A0A1B6DJR6_9HEMI